MADLDNALRRYAHPRRCLHQRPRRRRFAAADRRYAAELAQRRPVRAEPERRHGLGSGRDQPHPGADPQHPGRHPRRRRHADRAGLPHRPLGGRAADAGGRQGAARARLHAVRRLCDRPVRWPQPGHRGHARQPALPQRRRAGVPPADPLAADSPRGDGRGHLRQGPAGDADGAGRHAQPADHPGARRRDAAADRMARTPARSRRSARASPRASCR